MALTGDDCYFFYYSQCAKGDACPFRHCSAALGNETMCTLWLQGICSRPFCQFRHMEIRKERSMIPCYWETQPGGCSKPHCVFKHVLRPGDTPVLTQTTPAEPQGTAVTEPETGEDTPPYVPTPQVDPIIFNPFEEESDQESISTSGSPIKPPRMTEVKPAPGMVVRTSKSDVPDTEDLNFGIKTLRELHSEKPQNTRNVIETSDVKREKTKVAVHVRERPHLKSRLGGRLGGHSEKTAGASSEEEEESQTQRSVVTRRLGRRIIVTKDKEDDEEETAPQQKTSIKGRLGIFTKENPDKEDDKVETAPQQKTSVKSRLGIFTKEKPDAVQEEDIPTKKINIKSRLGLVAKEKSGNSEVSEDSISRVGVKALRELQQEKTMKTIQSRISPTADATKPKSKSSIKIKTLKEIQREKAAKASKRSITEKKEDKREDREMKVKTLEEIRAAKMARLSPALSKSDSEVGNIKVMTLEQIQKEKTEKMPASPDSTQDNDNLDSLTVKSLDDIRKENVKIKTLASSVDDSLDQGVDLGEIKIKSLEDIRREKAKRSHPEPTGISVTVVSTSDKTQVKVTRNEAQTKQQKFRKMGDAWRRAAHDAEQGIALLDAMTSPEKNKLARKLARPERQIYKPPGRANYEPKETAKEEPETRKKTETISSPVKRKTQDWGVKTFSEIMQEKQMRHRRPQQVIEIDSSGVDSSDGEKETLAVNVNNSSNIITDVSSTASINDNSSSIVEVSSTDDTESPLRTTTKRVPSQEMDTPSVAKKPRPSSEDATPTANPTDEAQASIKRRRSSSRGTHPSSDRRSSLKEGSKKTKLFNDSFFDDEDLDDLFGDVPVGNIATEKKDSEDDLLIEMDELLS